MYISKTYVQLPRMTEENVPSVEVTNLSVKAFRQMLTQKPSLRFHVLQVVRRALVNNRSEKRKSNSQINKLFKNLDHIFRCKRHDGLPPKQFVDDLFEVENVQNLLLRLLHNLFPSNRTADQNTKIGRLRNEISEEVSRHMLRYCLSRKKGMN